MTIFDQLIAMRDGGFWMIPILGFGAIAMAIAADRMFAVYRAGINATAFMAQIQKLIMANNIDRAIKLCNAEPHAVLPQVVKAGLTRANRTEAEIESAIEEASLEVAPRINKRTYYLAMLANVATLSGLLGTIWGLIQAFASLGGDIPPDQKQNLLASGISVAMYTTAGGLMVAIPILILHALLLQRSNRILDDVELYGLKVINLLAARRRGVLKSGAS